MNISQKLIIKRLPVSTVKGKGLFEPSDINDEECYPTVMILSLRVGFFYLNKYILLNNLKKKDGGV